jgi:hypothetical protein
MATTNSWNNQIAAANSAITLNSGTNTVSISTDASATTVNIATGGAAKTATFGSTNTTSSTVIKSGSGNIVSNSGMTIDSTGRMVNTTQPSFLASQTSDQSNVTGDGTVYTVTFTNVIFNQGSYFDGTSTFTAPVTGKYLFTCALDVSGLVSGTNNGLMSVKVAGTNAGTYRLIQGNLFTYGQGGGVAVTICGSVIVPMTATDTATVLIQVANGTKVVDILGSTSVGATIPIFSGALIC